MPTAMRPGCARHTSRTHGGFRMASVPMTTRCTPCSRYACNRLAVAHASANLHGDADRFEDAGDDLSVARLSADRTVQIHHVQQFGAGIGPAPGHGRRVIGVDGLVLHAPLDQADALAVFKIDCRYDQHGLNRESERIIKKTAFLTVDDSLQSLQEIVNSSRPHPCRWPGSTAGRRIAPLSFTGYSDPLEERTPVMRSSRATAWFSARPNDLNAASRM